MSRRRLNRSPWLAVLASTGLMALAAAPALGQQVAWGGHESCPPAPCPLPQIAPPPATVAPAPVPSTPAAPSTAPATPTTPSATPPTTPPGMAQAPSTDLALDQRSFAGGGETASVSNMIGDQFRFSGSSSSSRSTRTARTALVATNVHSFKVADNENVMPQDRIYFNFNYFNDVNRADDIRTHADIGKIDVYSYTVGFEKTLFDSNASIGMRIPLNRVNADNGFTVGTGGDFQDIGDLTIIGKYLFYRDHETGSAFSGGLAVTAPTGPRNFAGAPDSFINDVHDTLLQPFIGYRFVSGNWFLQGFEEIVIVTDSRDADLLFTDVGVGYFLMKDCSEGRWLTAVIPTVEAHLNDPLSHRGEFSGPFGITDWLVLTQGVILEFNRRSQLAIAVGEPVTGPKPYAVEAIAQFNFKF